MHRNIQSLAALALAGVFLLPATALPIWADGAKGKEEPAPQEPDDKDHKGKDDNAPEEHDASPKEPDNRAENDGPPFERPTTPPRKGKSRHVVVVEPHTVDPVYSYKSGANYCPAGLEPVSIAGEVSCGRPNQQKTYQQMLVHPTPRTARGPAAKPKTYHRVPQSPCQVGMKGCSDR